MQVIPRVKYENNLGGVPPQPKIVEDIPLIYPLHYKYTSNDPDDFLLWEHYSPECDTMFMCYKSYKTGERRIETIKSPLTPIFRSKRALKYNQETVRLDQTKKLFIPYLTKTDELRNMFFNATRVQYFDKNTGILREKFIHKDVPTNTEYLHPELYGGDITLETWMIADYTLKRYKPNKDGRLVESVIIPDLSFGCFDIETIIDSDGVTRIHTNTFIDYKAGKAYLDYWERPDFARVEELRNNTEEFIATFKKTLYDAIESSTISDPEKRAKIQKLSHQMTDNLEVIVTPFSSEAELIKRSTYRMFTESDCDVLMAFNAPFDLGKFQERVEKLGLPPNTLSSQKYTQYKDYKSLYAQNVVTRNGKVVRNGFINNKGEFEFRGDQIYPSKRTVFLPILCDKLVVDTAVLYYSARQNAADVSSYSLDATAQRTLGFGKFDYSHITDSILKLAQTDYYWHSIYALIDSILLGIIDMLGSETKSALQYKFRTKTSIYETASNNLAIPTCDIIDGYVMGYIFGNNVNKVLNSMSFKEIRQVANVIGFDYTARAKDVKQDDEKSLSGGCLNKINTGKMRPPFGVIRQNKSI